MNVWRPKMHLETCRQDSIVLICCRDVTTERKMYPSFAPEDFPAVYEASQKALQTAALANSRQSDSTARPHPLHQPLPLPLEDQKTYSGAKRTRAGHESAMCHSDNHGL